MAMRKYFIIFYFFICFFLPNNHIYALDKKETVALQLKWFHQFQFAGYFAAIEKGFYAEEGLDVVLRERNPESDHIEDVIDGEAQYGVADAGLLLSRLQGKPVVLLSQIFQHSPLVFLTLQKSGIRTPFDLIGKSVMIDRESAKYPSLNALIMKTLGGWNEVPRIPETYRNEDLVDGKTDAMVGYITDQPFWFKEKGIGVNVIDPRDYGIDFYGDNLFTAEKEIREHPQRVKKMIRATIKGWQYALAHQQEIVDLILKKYNSQKFSRKHLAYEAEETENMIVPGFINIGHFEPSRFQKIAEIYHRLGLTNLTKVDKGFFYKGATLQELDGSTEEEPRIKLTAEESDWLKAHPKIRVNGDEWAPFAIAKGSAGFEGISVDILRLVASRIGLEVEIVPGSWADLKEMLRNRELDVGISLVKTPEREEYLTFTDTYISMPNAIYVAKTTTDIHSIDDLSGKKVPVVKGFYLQEILADDYPDIEQVPVDSPLEGLQKVISGEADAYIGGLAVSQYLILQNLISRLKIAGYWNEWPVDLHMGIRSDYKILAGIIQKSLDTITEEHKARITAKYITPAESPTQRDKKLFTDQEKAWLKAHPLIRAHNEKEWPPFNYFEYGTPRGLSIDYMNLLAERLGIRVKYITGPSWNEFLSMIRKKDLDVMLNIVKTEDRQKYILYTEPYAKNPNVIVSSKKSPYESIEQLFGKTVAFPKGFFYEEVLTKSFPEIKRLPVEDILAGLKAVSFGKADAALGEEAVVRNLIVKNMLSDLYISGEVKLGNPDLTNLRIGIRDDWPLLQSAFMKAMADVAPKEMNQLRQKWLGGIEVQAGKTLEAAGEISFKRFFIYGLMIFLLLCVISWILIRSIQREDIAVNFGSSWFRGLVLAGLSVFVIIVVLLGWYTLEHNKTQHLHEVDENLRGILSISQDRLDLWLQERLSFLARLGRDPALVAMTKRLLEVDPRKDILLKSDELRKIRTFFKESKDIFPSIGFFIINPDHLSIGSMRDTNIGTRNLISDQHPELLKQAFRGQVGFVPPMTSDVFLGNRAQSEKNRKPPTMFFIGPVQGADGKVLAVMTLRVNPWEDFARAMKTFGGERIREIYAFDRNGTMLSLSRFEDQLRRIGLLNENQSSALNIEIRDPGGNMVEGYRSDTKRSQQPLTHMASAALSLKQKMERAGIRHGHSPVASNTIGYRDYRGVPVFGAWLWNEDLNVGLAVEVGADDALAQYNRTRTTVFSILGFTLLLSVGSVLLLLVLGERSSRALLRAKDDLEEKVAERTAELQENEGRLAEAEERGRLLLNSAGEGIFGVDTDGRLNFINPTAITMLGFSEDEMVGQKVHELFHHSHEDGALYPVENCPMFKSFTEGTSHRVADEVLWRKDGTYFPVEYSSTPMEKDDSLVGAVITFRDVTERKAAEERFAALLESAPDAMVVSDETGNIVLVNSQAETVFGYSREEFISNNVDMLVPEEIRAAHPSKRAKFYADPKRLSMGFRGNFFGIAKDGRKIPIDVGLSPIKTEDGLFVVASIRDITERRRMEKALSEEHDRLQRVLDTCPVAVAISVDGVVQYSNDFSAEFYGVKKGDVPIHVYVNPKDRDYLTKELERTGMVRNYELKTYNFKREICDALSYYFKIEYEGKPAVLGWWVDITEMKKTTQELEIKFDELTRFRRLAVGREKKMIELKKEINESLKECGHPEKYKIH